MRPTALYQLSRSLQRAFVPARGRSTADQRLLLLRMGGIQLRKTALVANFALLAPVGSAQKRTCTLVHPPDSDVCAVSRSRTPARYYCLRVCCSCGSTAAWTCYYAYLVALFVLKKSMPLRTSYSRTFLLVFYLSYAAPRISLQTRGYAATRILYKYLVLITDT